MPNPHDQAIEAAELAVTDNFLDYDNGRIGTDEFARRIVVAVFSSLPRTDLVSREGVLRGLEEWYVQNGGDVCDFHKLADYVRGLPSPPRAPDEFKAYVHKRLDDAGIPTHPDGPHSKEGCRVGDRLDIALSRTPAWKSEEELAEAFRHARTANGLFLIGAVLQDETLRALARIALRAPEPAAVVCPRCNGSKTICIRAGAPDEAVMKPCPACAPSDEGGKR